MHTLILLRHGQSLWNKENRFTGWTDIDLTADGKQQAKEAAELLMDRNIMPDIVFSSILKRSIRTTWLLLDAMDRMWVPVHLSWRLNERHYGALQGMNKAEMAIKYGEEQVHKWRRGYADTPPRLSREQFLKQLEDPVFSSVPEPDQPNGESLKDTISRTLPFWNATIVPEVRNGKTALISGHHNSLRALVKVLENISDEEILDVNIPTGIPLVYTLDDDFIIRNKEFLGDPKKIAQAIEDVVNQAKALK